MLTLHLTNTDFEFELAKPNLQLSIEQAWSQYPLCLQLQFLPLLYAKSEEAIVVTALPSAAFIQKLQQASWRQGALLPKLILLSSEDISNQYSCLAWGASQRVHKWAKEKRVKYTMPDWQVVQEVNSKLFSYMQSPALAHSALIEDVSHLKAWLSSTKGIKRVLKTCFGVSGRGHRLIEAHTIEFEAIASFCEREWRQNRPLIGEPWLDRILDFSTQWHLSRQGDIQFIGATQFETDANGIYRATFAGLESTLFESYQSFLNEHHKIALEILQKMSTKGFFGYVGIDAFLYQCPDKGTCLRPIVEINGRQTMSLAALQFQRRWFPNQTIRLFFNKMQHNQTLLPDSLSTENGKLISFNRQLHFEILK